MALAVFLRGSTVEFPLRAVSPQLTQEFAQAHDEMWQCLCRMLSIHPDYGAQEQSSLPL